MKQFDKGQELSIPTDFCKQMCNTRRQRDSDHDKTLTKIFIKGETRNYLTEVFTQDSTYFESTIFLRILSEDLSFGKFFKMAGCSISKAVLEGGNLRI